MPVADRSSTLCPSRVLYFQTQLSLLLLLPPSAGLCQLPPLVGSSQFGEDWHRRTKFLFPQPLLSGDDVQILHHSMQGFLNSEPHPRVRVSLSLPHVNVEDLFCAMSPKLHLTHFLSIIYFSCLLLPFGLTNICFWTQTWTLQMFQLAKSEQARLEGLLARQKSFLMGPQG